MARGRTATAHAGAAGGVSERDSGAAVRSSCRFILASMRRSAVSPQTSRMTDRRERPGSSSSSALMRDGGRVVDRFSDHLGLLSERFLPKLPRGSPVRLPKHHVRTKDSHVRNGRDCPRANAAIITLCVPVGCRPIVDSGQRGRACPGRRCEPAKEKRLAVVRVTIDDNNAGTARTGDGARPALN